MDFFKIENVMRQAKSMVLNPQVATYAGIIITTSMLAYFTIFDSKVSDKSERESEPEERESEREPEREPEEEEEEESEPEEPAPPSEQTGGKRKKKTRMNKNMEKKKQIKT